ncbi:MAG: lipopolysaccharide heptosyltransferase II [bacterium]|nr:lipopolysaccharide heptosyltransferase II [bacterium]
MDKILIIQTAFIGDVVLISPLIEAISDKYPKAKLYLLTTLEGKDIFERNPHIYNILSYDKRKRDKGLNHFIRIVKHIKKIKFDTAVIPHPSLRSSLIAYFAKIPYRVGFRGRIGAIFFNNKVSYPLEFHEVERNLQLAYALGVKKKYRPLKIYISQDEKEFASKFFKENKILEDDFLVGINPCSVWPTKRWKPEGFAEVADNFIKNLKAKIILLGGPKDKQIVEKVSNLMKEEAVLAVGKFNLRKLSAVLEKCKLFITNDSGPMHIAMAMKTPTVAIFGPTTLAIGFGPYGEKYKVIEKKGLKCRPCSLHGPKRCPIGTFDCMNSITSEKVIMASKELFRT